MKFITLGHHDPEAEMPDWDAYFDKYHHKEMKPWSRRREFRKEMLKAWAKLSKHTPDKKHPEFTVRFLQNFLKHSGFGPFMKVDGICGYRTFSSLRLFQEYVRSVDQEAGIGFPDGIAGKKTFKFLKKWERKDKKAAWINRNIGPHNPSPEYLQWLDLLQKVQQQQFSQMSPALKLIENFEGRTDTRKVAEWDFRPSHTHLIGIRRKQGVSRYNRENDDVFVLLINGMVLKFFGTTDPHTLQGQGKTEGAPFLTRGQHLYHYGWHKVGDKDKIYRALQPYSKYSTLGGKGVLIFRDANNDGLKSEDLVSQKLQPNDSINIHWGGTRTKGSSNWSAGCQAICGLSYINPLDQLIDCKAFAANRYQELGKKLFKVNRFKGVRQTFGAYSLLIDMLIVFAPPESTEVLYTLLYEDDLSLDSSFGKAYALELNHRLRML